MAINSISCTNFIDYHCTGIFELFHRCNMANESCFLGSNEICGGNRTHAYITRNVNDSYILCLYWKKNVTQDQVQQSVALWPIEATGLR